MSLKTFSAKSMPQALAMVRRELGADAVVLHTRTYRRGGVLGFGAKPVVEITAMSGRELARTRQKPVKSWKSREIKARNAARSEAIASAPGSSRPAAEPLAGELIRRTYAAARAEMQPTSPSVDRSPPHAEARTPSVALVPPSDSGVDASAKFAAELSAVRALVQRVAERQDAEAQRAARLAEQHRLKADAEDAGFEVPDALVAYYTRMIQEEVSDEIARRVLDRVRADDSAADTNADAVDMAAIQRQLAALLPTQETSGGNELGDDMPAPVGRSKVIALVGPTGVGKTTTIAKLAATYKLKQGRNVGVITLDTYRIAAVDQLRTYCSIIGCPMEVANRPEELRVGLQTLSECDVVLIDTAGRSQRDDAKLDELAAFIGVAEPDETHLVLAATASQRVMLQIAERFARVCPDRVIFTKLDEAVACGTLFNVALKIGARLSYVTTGQEVPHQIEPADALRLARRVFGEADTASPRVAEDPRQTPGVQVI